ncbi:MAG: hypothetical protein RL648_470, partial [Verrucomicrobiota bacterium]
MKRGSLVGVLWVVAGLSLMAEPRVTQRSYGELAGGEQVAEFTLSNDKGMTVRII